jgi:hypothetical protein
MPSLDCMAGMPVSVDPGTRHVCTHDAWALLSEEIQRQRRDKGPPAIPTVRIKRARGYSLVRLLRCDGSSRSRRTVRRAFQLQRRRAICTATTEIEMTRRLRAIQCSCAVILATYARSAYASPTGSDEPPATREQNISHISEVFYLSPEVGAEYVGLQTLHLTRELFPTASIPPTSGQWWGSGRVFGSCSSRWAPFSLRPLS